MDKMKTLSNKHVLITGAASGIGRATALAMGRERSRLFLTDIDGEGLRKTVDAISKAGGTVCLARALDVGDYRAMHEFAKDIHEQCGSLDIVINVAGIALFSQIENMRHSDWEKVVHVNLWGVIHGLECFVPRMIEAGKGGHIVSVSSTAGLIGLPWHAAYAATKHAIVGISEVLRYDLRKHNIGVTVVCPGAVDTGLVNMADIRSDNTAAADKSRQLFRKIAMPPGKVADKIVKAIRADRFMEITSLDIKLFYFVKRCCFPIYHLVMLTIKHIMDKSLKRNI